MGQNIAQGPPQMNRPPSNMGNPVGPPNGMPPGGMPPGGMLPGGVRPMGPPPGNMAASGVQPQNRPGGLSGAPSTGNLFGANPLGQPPK